MPKPLFLQNSTKCVCGHPYEDHCQKAPHRCLEDHASRAGHACSCTTFTAPMTDGWAPGIHYAPDATIEAARSGATMVLERVLASIPRSDFSNVS